MVARHPNCRIFALVLVLAAGLLGSCVLLLLNGGARQRFEERQLLRSAAGRQQMLLMSREQQSRRQQQQPGHRHRVCPQAEDRRAAIDAAEPLIAEEPRHPWVVLKRNLERIVYLPALLDVLSPAARRVYIDVGSRNYASSVGGWFKRRYQPSVSALGSNSSSSSNFTIFAIEADASFHAGYGKHRDVTLLPYAAWTHWERLRFAAAEDGKPVGQGGMGRIVRGVNGQVSGGGSTAAAVVAEVQGFDFAEWLAATVRAEDFVVVKMDVEGAEFELVERLWETGAVCLIDELFLECHYNRWQKCCPGQRSAKFAATYARCHRLLSSLRHAGVLAHQWW